MKRLFILILLVLFAKAFFAQDYKVTSIDYLQGDMTARKTVLTERLDGGQQCAVLRIATQNILVRDRDAFQFECDMGSVIRERRKDGGEICLWVSPGIKILKIKHSTLGNYVLNIGEFLHGNVMSLNTYQVNIVGLKELPDEPLAIGSCQVLFRPDPANAVLYLNGDSIGDGVQLYRGISGVYDWSIQHPLYQAKTGSVELRKGSMDTVDVRLMPAYGYVRILDDYGVEEDEIKVYFNGNKVGAVPYESGRLASGVYDVVLERNDMPLASGSIEVLDCQIAEETLKDFVSKEKNVSYKPVNGVVEITSSPIGANIMIDGENKGVTPMTIDDMLIGPHSVRLSKNGCTPVEQEFIVEENAVKKLHVELPKGCVVSVSTDESGDRIFVDGQYVGETPLSLDAAFGNHILRVERNGYFIEKACCFVPSRPKESIVMTFGQQVKVESDGKRDKIYVDGEYKGRAPLNVYLSNGDHALEAFRGWKIGKRQVVVEEGISLDPVHINKRVERPNSYLARGVFFVSGNMAWLPKDLPHRDPSYGISFGNIKGAGWFMSFITNGNFDFMGSYKSSDATGHIQHQFPNYSGEEAVTRFSVMAGGALDLGGTMFLRVGAGYGMRQYVWKTADSNEWVVIEPYSWKNAEVSLGLQCCIYNFVLNADFLIPVDVLTQGKKLYEIRAGVGFCISHGHKK